MEFNPFIVFPILAVLTIGAGAVIWAIVRFSFISERRTRDWQKRLRLPRPDEFPLASSERVAAFYRTSPLIEESDIALRAPDGTTWEIEHFIPFTKIDVTEWKKITGIAGIPIATDYAKGVYFLREVSDQTGLFYLPAGRKKKEVLVVSDVHDLDSFARAENA